MAAVPVDPALRVAVWQRFEEERPKAGPATVDWTAAMAEETGTSTHTIRKIIAEGASAFLTAFSVRAQTYAQQVAEMLGANLVAAFDMLRESLHATKKKVLLDKSGRPKLLNDISIEMGGPGYVPENMIYIEMPDWHARLSAIRTIVEVFGGRAPTQVEISSKSVVFNLSAKDAMAELQRLSTELPRLQQAYAAFAETDSHALGPGEGSTGTVIN